MKFKRKSTLVVSLAIALAAVGTVTAFAADAEPESPAELTTVEIGPSDGAVITGRYTAEGDVLGEHEGDIKVAIVNLEDGSFECVETDASDIKIRYDYDWTEVDESAAQELDAGGVQVQYKIVSEDK